MVKTALKDRGGSRISGKGVHMFKGEGVHFADLISFFLNRSCKLSYDISKRGDVRGFKPLWIRH